MKTPNKELTASQANSAGDAEAIRHLEQAICGGKHWYLALLEAMGLWTSTEETRNGRTYRYLIEGEAFDWLLLAERLCEAVDGFLPDDEKSELLFQGRPPLSLSAVEVEKLIGSSKYHEYLNYFYGVTVEEFMLLAAQEEVHKGRWMSGSGSEEKIIDEAYQKIYSDNKETLFKCFRKEKGYPNRNSTTLTEQKEFTYWLFKYRVRRSEKAKVASDTRKALKYLEQQRASRFFWGSIDSCGQLGG